MAKVPITKRTEYAEKWVNCCGQRIGGTYIKRSGYIFICAECGNTFRGGLWIRTWLWGKLQNYENYSSLRKVINRWVRKILAV